MNQNSTILAAALLLIGGGIATYFLLRKSTPTPHNKPAEYNYYEDIAEAQAEHDKWYNLYLSSVDPTKKNEYKLLYEYWYEKLCNYQKWQDEIDQNKH